MRINRAANKKVLGLVMQSQYLVAGHLGNVSYSYIWLNLD